ncbi:MAG: undecaprenyl-phosphate galactose phosphotransferase WbaP [Candidatus Aminicenantes bacterium]|nr:undecaprenyl-phosphate galactose phosphotransferase WbaP [Candidatus Aminicenantes bacterium]
MMKSPLTEMQIFGRQARKYVAFFSLVLSDLAAVTLSFYVAYAVRAYVLTRVFTHAFIWGVDWREFSSRWYALGLWVVVFAYEKLYVKRLSIWEETRVVIKAHTIVFGFIAVSFFALRSYFPFSRLILTMAWLLGIAFLPAFRYGTKRLLILSGLWRKRIVVIGSSEAAAEVIAAIRSTRTMGYRTVGCLTDDRTRIGESIAGVPILGHFEDVEDIRERTPFEDIVVTFPNLPHDRLIELLKRWDGVAETIRLVPQTGDFITAGVEIENIGKILSLVARKNLHKPWNILLKAAFEFGLALVAFLLLLPVFLVIAAAVKLTSPGPAFFVQERFGRRGRTIEIIKFRTMHLDAGRRLEDHLKADPAARAEWETYKKLKTFDPRVTRVGRFLRRHSLDELPQMVNVIRGDMSLVGPRPYLREELQELKQVKSILFQVKPGITGLWQTSGRSDVPFAERLRLDEQYIRNWSLWTDIVILLKTVRVTLLGRGAF